MGTRRGKAVWPAVFDYLASHPNLQLQVREIATQTSLDEKQIQNAIHRAREVYEGMDAAIEVVVRGNCWIYHPNRMASAKGARVYEDAYVSKNGTQLIEREDGVLFVLGRQVDL
jgi:hypothetical protein